MEEVGVTHDREDIMDTEKRNKKKAHDPETNVTQRSTRRGGGEWEQILDPLKEITKRMKDRSWQQMDYKQKKTYLLNKLPGFLDKHLEPENVQKALHPLHELPASDFLCILL